MRLGYAESTSEAMQKRKKKKKFALLGTKWAHSGPGEGLPYV